MYKKEEKVKFLLISDWKILCVCECFCSFGWNEKPMKVYWNYPVYSKKKYNSFVTFSSEFFYKINDRIFVLNPVLQQLGILFKNRKCNKTVVFFFRKTNESLLELSSLFEKKNTTVLLYFLLLNSIPNCCSTGLRTNILSFIL